MSKGARFVTVFDEQENAGNVGAIAHAWDFVAPLEVSTALVQGHNIPSFTRATIKTFVDWEGTIRQVPSGCVAFQGARMVRNYVSGTSFRPTGGGAITVNSTTIDAPDGALVAERFTVDNAATYQRYFSGALTAAVAAGQTATNSFYVRGVGASVGKTVQLWLYDNGVSVNQLVALTAGWQRVALSRANYTGGPDNRMGLLGGGTIAVGNQIDMVYGQFEIVTGQSNLAPSEFVFHVVDRLNEATDTETLDTTSWAKFNAAVTPDAVIAPDGRLTADKVTENAAAGVVHSVAPTIPGSVQLTGAGPLVHVAYLKAAERDHATVYASGSGVRAMASFNLINGTVRATRFVGIAGMNTSVEDVGNGWWRCAVFFNFGANAFSTVSLMSDDGVTALSDAGVSFNGVAGNGFYAWGEQLVRGAVVTSYFPVGNSYPFYGAHVDGVKFFDYENANTVTAGIVTEAVGPALPANGLGIGNIPANASTSHFSTPSFAAIQATGDHAWEIDLVFGSITVNNWFCNKGNPNSIDGWRALLVGATSRPQLLWYDGAARTATATAAWPYAAGTRGQLRIELDVDNGAGGSTVKFFHRANKTQAWVQLGGTITNAFTTQVVGSATRVQVGSTIDSGGDGFTAGGSVFGFKLFMGLLATTPNIDFTPTNWTSGATFIGGQGETWTINGGARILKVPRGYYVERSSSNIVLQSENFGTTWAAIGTPTRVAAARRCGLVTLDLIGDDDAATTEFYRQTILFTGNAVKAISCFIARDTSTSTLLQLSDVSAGANRLLAAITWVNGDPVVTMTTGTLLGVDYLSNGVYRVRMATTAVTAANTNQLNIYPANTAGGAAANTGTIYVGGVQFENALECSSYIPTTTAAVTRNTDQLAYGAAAAYVAQGTFYCESRIFPEAGPTQAVYASFDPAAGGHILTKPFGAPLTTLSTWDGATNTSVVGAPDLSTDVRRLASTWGSGAKSVTANGMTPVSGAFDGTMGDGTIFTIGQNNGGGNSINGIIRNVKVSSLAKPAFLQLLTA